MASKRPAPKKTATKRATTKKKAPKRPAAKKSAPKRATTKKAAPKRTTKARAGRPSSLLDTRIIHCGDCLDQLAKLPDGCVDLIYIDPPFNSNRNYEVFWGELKEKRVLEDRRANTQADIRPHCVEFRRTRSLLCP